MEIVLNELRRRGYARNMAISKSDTSGRVRETRISANSGKRAFRAKISGKSASLENAGGRMSTQVDTQAGEQ